MRAMVVLAVVGFSGSAVAQCDGCAAPAGGGGLLGRLNQPLVPGATAVPGVAPLSPLGLIAPRLAFLADARQMGGLFDPANRLNLTGFAFPRLAPVMGFQQAGFTPQGGLAILSPRLAVGAGLFQGARAQGGGLFAGRRCR